MHETLILLVHFCQNSAVVNLTAPKCLLFVCFFPFHQPSSSVSKPKTEDEATEPEEPNLLERMIEALHMELLFVRHRIAVKLANLGQGIAVEISEVLMVRLKRVGVGGGLQRKNIESIEMMKGNSIKVE